MIIRAFDDVTSDALAAMRRTADPRLREILVCLVKHRHGFVREVRLTEPEFPEAAAIVNEIGKFGADTHDEAVLMTGSLGISSRVCLLNNGDGGVAETSQSVLGPFWRLGSPRVQNGGSIVRSETTGAALFVTGRARVAGEEVDVRHASSTGLYENRDGGRRGDPAEAAVSLGPAGTLRMIFEREFHVRGALRLSACPDARWRRPTRARRRDNPPKR